MSTGESGRGRLVVLTRQPAQAGRLEAGLREAGWEIAFLPLTDFEVPADLSSLHDSLRQLQAGQYAWLLITSPNAARALAHAGWDGSLPDGTRVAVTGAGTARTLPELGCTATPWMPDGQASAAGIVQQFPTASTVAAAPSYGRVLLPQSQRAEDTVAAGLTARGWTVDRVEAYRTVPYPAAPARRLLPAPENDPALLRWEELDGSAVVLTSPSAVQELLRFRDELPTGVDWIAIGQPTQRAAEAAGLDLTGTAPTPDAAGILSVLTELSGSSR